MLFDADGVVAVNKPPGVSLATRRAEPGAAVARLLDALPADERAAHELATGRVLLVHRLDVGTTGVVLLARDEATHRALAVALTEGSVEKQYLALVWGRPRPAQGVWAWALAPDRRDRRRMRVAPDGRRAVSEYAVIAARRPVGLLRLRPRTGRTHQLRVHAAHAGHPIVGDDLYGGPRHRGVRERDLRAALQPSHPLLHAWRLRFAARAGEVEVVAPLPSDFTVALQALALDRAADEVGHPPAR